MQKKPRVIIPSDIGDIPSDDEMLVARILANYFHKDVEFVPRGLQKTADYLIDRRYLGVENSGGRW